jgi:hypothetical protein
VFVVSNDDNRFDTFVDFTYHIGATYLGVHDLIGDYYCLIDSGFDDNDDRDKRNHDGRSAHYNNDINDNNNDVVGRFRCARRSLST